jgi:magnesium transporter
VAGADEQLEQKEREQKEQKEQKEPKREPQRNCGCNRRHFRAPFSDPMITAWLPSEKGLQRVQVEPGSLPADPVWVDLYEVSREEEIAVEKAYGVEIPTREEMTGIEASSRLYREPNAVYMSSTMLIKTESDHPESSVVTFIYMRERLITLRYTDPWSFRIFAQRLGKLQGAQYSSENLFIGLMEATVERLADLIERAAGELEVFSQQVFLKHTATENVIDLQEVIHGLGRSGNVLSKVRESLVDKNRLIAFSEQACKDWISTEARDRIRVLVQDIHSLADHVTFTSNKLSFLLDATYGLITVEQNNIIKIFSVAAVVLLPPTLVASIFGMNYHLPWQESRYGFTVAIVLMIISAIIPLWYFKKKRWL